MSNTIGPNIDAVKMIDQTFEMKKAKPDMQNKMIVISVGFWTVTEEVDILPHALSVAKILQNYDAVLHNGVVVLVADFGREVGRGEVHQH